MNAITTIKMLPMILLLSSATIFAQTASAPQSKNEKIMETPTLNTYVIERQIPGAGNLTSVELKNISQTSCTVLKEMGPNIEWVQSYVTGDKIFCIYRAQNEEVLKEHAKKGGFPINSIYLVSTTISPATAQ